MYLSIYVFLFKVVASAVLKGQSLTIAFPSLPFPSLLFQRSCPLSCPPQARLLELKMQHMNEVHMRRMKEKADAAEKERQLREERDGLK